MKAAGQSSSSRAMTWFRLVLALGSLLGGFGCKPKIGEDCATSVDCSINGDRLCDVTLPGGYCTVFNCEPNGCPDEAVCVAFGEGTCSNPAVSTRFRRTFCMRSCEGDSDCRGGSYKCIDLSRDQSRQVVDTNPSNRRICGVPSSYGTSPPPAPPPDPAVCFPSDASFDVSRPETGPVSRDAPAETDGTDANAADITLDRADARIDANDGSPTSEAATSDVGDSSFGETGADDVTGDGSDANEDALTDAAEESEAAL